jgi:CRP-like cAMP-binding protein
MDVEIRATVFGAAAAPIRRGNRLLDGLPNAERRKLMARCETVELNFGDVLCERDERMSHVYFPFDSFISLISSTDDHSRLEVGLIGAEGMLGASLILGVNIAPARALVRGPGSALRLDANQFSRATKQSAALEQKLKRYLCVVVSQVARTAACIHFHVIEARLARWLLMTRDRVCSDEFQLTQEEAAYVLGVRRAGITGAAIALQKRRLIRYKRGTVTILDGPGLEGAACQCYAAATQTYTRIMRERVRSVV